MGAFDDILRSAGIPPSGGSSLGTLNSTPQRKGPFDDLLAEAGLQPLGGGDYSGATPPPVEEPGLGMKVLHGVGAVVGAPKRAIDWLARTGAKELYGLKVPEEATTGSMLRAAAGLGPGVEADQGYGERLGGKAIEFVGDLATDPLTYALAGAPKIISKVATPAFTTLMGAGAIEEGGEAIKRFQEEGFTPATAEAAFGAGLSGAFAGLGAKHMLRGGEHVPAIERVIEPERPGAPSTTWPSGEPSQAAPPPPDLIERYQRMLASKAARAAEVAPEPIPEAPVVHGAPVEAVVPDLTSPAEAPSSPLTVKHPGESDPRLTRAGWAELERRARELVGDGEPTRKALLDGLEPIDGLRISPSQAGKLVERLRAAPAEPPAGPPEPPPASAPQPPADGGPAVPVEPGPPAGVPPPAVVETAPVPVPAEAPVPVETAPAPSPPVVRATPDRSLKVGRGAHGSVDVEFEDSWHKQLFSAVGRSRRAMRGEPGYSPNWEGLAKAFGVDRKAIYQLAEDYRARIMEGVKGLPEGEVFRAPAAIEKATPEPAPTVAAPEAPPTPEAPRGPERRIEALPVEAERRIAQRRTQLAEEHGVPETDPLIEKVIQGEESARVDQLTGLGNRRHWDDVKASLHPENDDVVMVDLEKFKPVNDTFGHAAGDEMLRRVSRVLKSHFGEEVARTGGDEFNGAFRGLTPEQAEAKIAQMHADIRTATTMQLRNPKTGEVVDVPGLGAHIGRARGEHAELAADTAANVAAEASRAGGRGSGTPPEGTVPPVSGTEPGTGGAAPAGLGDRPAAVVEPAAPARRPIRPIKGLPPAFQLLKDQALARGVDAARIDRLMESASGREAIRGFLSQPEGTPGKVAVLPEGEKKLPTAEGVLFDETKAPTPRPELEAQQTAALAEAPETARVFADASKAAREAGAERTKAQEKRAVAKAAKRSRTRMEAELVTAATKEAGRRPRSGADVRAEEADKGAVTVGKVRVANPDPAMAEVAKRLAERTQSFVPAIEEVLARAAQKLGVEAKLHSLTLDSNIDANVSPGGQVRSNLMAAVETAIEKARRRGHRYEAKDVPGFISREIARHVLNPIIHELAHLKADAMVAADPAFASTMDKTGHGPGFNETLREAYRSVAGDRAQLRRHLESALDSKGGRVRSSLQRLWPELEPHWRRLDAERLEREGKGKPPRNVRGNDRGGSSEAVRAGGRGSPEGGPTGGDGGGLQPGGPVQGGDGGPAGELAAAPAAGGTPGTVEKPRAAKSGSQPGIPGINRNQSLSSPASFRDMLVEGYKGNILSGPGTQVVNIASVGLDTGYRVYETALSGAIDRILGGPRTRFSGAALDEAKGALEHLPGGLAAFGSGLRQALSSEGAIPKKYGGGLFRAPFKVMEAADAGTSVMGRGAELAKMAANEARKRLPGAPPSQVATLAAQLRANPPAEWIEAVDRKVLDRQFKTPQTPDGLIEYINKAKSKNRWLELVFPFTNTPSNVIKTALGRTPLGFKEGFGAYRAFKDAQRRGVTGEQLEALKGEAVDKLVRPIAGTLAFGMLTGYAASGGMVGSGPKDPKDRAALRAAGWQPYSFVIPTANGKAYVPFARFQPVSNLLMLAADAVELKDGKEKGELASKFIAMAKSSILDQPYLSGLADVSEFLNDPTRGSAYVSSLASALVPNIVSKAAQAIDPTVRDTTPSDTGLTGLPERVVKTLQSRIPGLSQMLPAKMEPTGGEAKRPGEGVLGAASRFLSPIQVSTEKPGADLSRLLVDLGAVPGQPSRDLALPGTHGKKIPLTEDEYSVLQESNKIASDYLERLVSRPSFQRLDPEEQKRQVQLVYDRARTLQRNKLTSSRAFRARARSFLQGQA